MSQFIRRALIKLVKDKKIVQTKGTGASGRFKAAFDLEKVKKPKKLSAAVKKLAKTRHDPYSNFECKKCGTLFEKKGDFQRHISMSRIYSCKETSCPLCNMPFATKQAVEFHFQSQHKNQSRSMIHHSYSTM